MPNIHDLATGRTFPLPPNSTFLVGRSREADLPVHDISCSRMQFRLDVDGDAVCHLHPLSANSPTFCEGIAIHDQIRLDQDVEISAGQSTFRFAVSEQAPGPAVIEPAPTVLNAVDGPVQPLDRIRIKADAFIGRDPEQADILLPHVQVSRKHARITLHRDGAILSDQGSSGGTFLNGRRLKVAQRISNGDRIGIGPYDLRFDSGFLVGESREDNLQLVARGLSKSIKDAAGKSQCLLDDISLVIRPHEFACVIGPEPARTTLLAVLSAQSNVDSGRVTFNGADLRNRHAQLKHDVAIVASHSQLHGALTIAQSLEYAARLRLPADIRYVEIERAIEETIGRVDLRSHRYDKIRDLSTSEFRRVHVAHEMITNPSVIFVDDISAGHDGQSERQFVEMLRSLTDLGKTVVCTSKHLASIEDSCHLIVILTNAGRLAFVGPPEDALAYFDVDRLDEISEQLNSRGDDALGRDALQSEWHADYVTSRLAAATPIDEDANQGEEPLATPRRSLRTHLRQLRVMLSRNTALIRSDRWSLAASFGECLLLAFVIALAFGSAKPGMTSSNSLGHWGNLLLSLTISSLWLGGRLAVGEFIKERDVLVQENEAGLSVLVYYLSKLLPLCLLAAFQSSLVYGIVAMSCALPGAGIGGLAAVSLLAIVGVSGGLAISSLTKSSEQAIVWLTLILAVQMLFSSGVVPLGGWVSRVSQVAVSSLSGLDFLRTTLPADLRSQFEAMSLELPRRLVAPASGLQSMLTLAAQFMLGAVIAVLTLEYRCRACGGKLKN